MAVWLLSGPRGWLLSSSRLKETMLPTYLVVLGAVLLGMSVDALRERDHDSSSSSSSSSADYHPTRKQQHTPRKPSLDRSKRDFSSSSSSSVSGFPPVTQTYVSGNGVASASTYQQPGVVYYYVPVATHHAPAATSSSASASSGVPPRFRRDNVQFDHRFDRNDANQQITQKDPPIAFSPPPASSLSFAPASSFVQPAFLSGPPSFSAPAGISQSQAAGFENSFPREALASYQLSKSSLGPNEVGAEAFVGGTDTFAAAAPRNIYRAYGPPAVEAGAFAGANALAGAAAPPAPPPPPPPPPPSYSPPVEAGAGAGADALAGAFAPPPPRIPHAVYGLPLERSLIGSGEDGFRELQFIPAFPDRPTPAGVELSPPAPGAFVPPDGALLAPPAEGPAPRNPERRVYF